MSEESSVIDQLKNLFVSRPEKRDSPAGRPESAQAQAQAKPARYLALLGLLGLALLIYGSFRPADESGPGTSGTPPASVSGFEKVPVAGSSGDPASNYRYTLERDLESILSRVDGAGRVSVMVRLSKGPSSIYSVDRTNQSRITTEPGTGQNGRLIEERDTTEKVVTVRDDASKREVPVMVSQELPEILGALIVAEGASNPEVEYRLLKAAETVLGLPTHRIVILPGR